MAPEHWTKRGGRRRPHQVRFVLLVFLLALVGSSPNTASRARGTPPPGVYFSDDFEGDVSGWLVQSPWAVTTESAHSGTHAWSDSPGGNYAPNSALTITSPLIDLSSATYPQLKFWEHHFFAATEPDPLHVVDFGIVSVTTDNFVTFHTVGSQFKNRNDTWTEWTFNLTEFAGAASLRVVFTLVSDATVERDGWYIDDVSVSEGPPPAFNKVAPSNGSRVPAEPLFPNIKWTAADGATSYEYCIDTTNNDSCDGTWTDAGFQREVTLPGLANSTFYWWQVRARFGPNGPIEADNGSWWSFMSNGPPAAFTKSAPADGAMGQPLSLNVSWTPSTGSTSFEYCVDTIDNNTCDTGWTGAAGTSAMIGGLAPGTTYWWQVRALNSEGVTESNGGTWWAFTTGVPPAPFDKTHGATRATPTLIWNASGGATSYEYCVDTTNNSVCDGTWTSTTGTSAGLGTFSSILTSFWQVRAVNAIGVTEANGGAWWSMRGATANDFDGDGKTGVAVYRPSTGGWYYLKSSTNNTTSAGVSWGLSTDQPMPGDYDGDGRTDPAIFRPSTGLWAILKSSTSYTTSMTVSWGLSTDLPMPADYDGDGKTDPAVYRPSTGGWYVLKSSTNYTTSFGVSWGLSTDVPLPGDYDGDGKADPAVFRPSTGGWYILKSSTSYTTSFGVVCGVSTDVPVPGDYDGDGKTDPAVFTPSTGGWNALRSSTNYSTSLNVSWGLSTDLPVPGDFDGDGKIDPTVFRPSTGFWYSLKSSVDYSSYSGVSWGLSTDVPVGRRP